MSEHQRKEGVLEFYKYSNEALHLGTIEGDDVYANVRALASSYWQSQTYYEPAEDSFEIWDYEVEYFDNCGPIPANDALDDLLEETLLEQDDWVFTKIRHMKDWPKKPVQESKLSEKRASKKENTLKAKVTKDKVVAAIKEYFEGDERVSLDKKADSSGYFEIEMKGKKPKKIVIIIDVNEKMGVYTISDRDNLIPDLYFRGTSEDEASVDGRSAAKDINTYVKEHYVAPLKEALNEVHEKDLSTILVAFKASDPKKKPLVNGKGQTWAVPYDSSKTNEENIKNLKNVLKKNGVSEESLKALKFKRIPA